MAAAPATCDEFVDLLRKSGIIAPAVFDNLGKLPGEPTACAAALIAKGHLTKFQAKLLLTGRWKGFKLGPYVVRDQIGQGGMGAVYLAEHETLRRKVALKVLTPPKDTKDGKLALERFIREARSAAALDHPNIVRLHDVGHSGHTHYLVMEFVEGQTLDELMTKAGPLAPGRAAGYVAQAAAGLQHAYDKGFIHRDIKPSNLMLTKDGHIKILDMGLARPTDESSGKLTEVFDQGAVVGTADFISPEQAMNGLLDIRSDIYSLGASFFALVTGAPPFVGSTTQKLIQHQMKAAPTLAELDKTFPHGLSKVVATMLEKKAVDRYQSPAELIAALAEWLPLEESRKVAAGLSGKASAELENTLSEIQSTTRRFATSTRLAVRRAKQKRMAMWGAIAVAALALGGVGGYFAFAPAKKEPAVVERTPTPAFEQPLAKIVESISPVEISNDTRKSAVKSQVLPKTPSTHLVQLPVEHFLPFTLKLSRPDALKETYLGEGKLPASWYKWVEMAGSEAEIVFEDAHSQKSLGLRMTKGGGGFSLNAPEFNVPASGKVTVVATYLTEAKSPDASLRFRQMKPITKTNDILSLPKTSGKWVTITKQLDLKGATSGLFELWTAGTGAEASLRFAKFDVLPVE